MITLLGKMAKELYPEVGIIKRDGKKISKSNSGYIHLFQFFQQKYRGKMLNIRQSAQVSILSSIQSNTCKIGKQSRSNCLGHCKTIFCSVIITSVSQCVDSLKTKSSFQRNSLQRIDSSS
jgi:hypothetical protein